MKRWFVIPSMFAFAALMLGTPDFALAQDHAAMVEERVGIMKTVSRTLKGLQKSAKSGKVGSQDAERAAKALAGAKKLAKLFPPGSHAGVIKTRAKEGIWKEWAKFEGQLGKLIAELDNVQKAAAAGNADAMGKAVKAARGTCGGCHKPFRGPKPK